ncbi:putative LPS assembly protein LptD [Bergeyella sp. RCAD1439]|uniref:putative LPS assembly protein LptD n=1 Tax=Bergeyella anatis TaxID=3113737 RepID=UPI002E196515|nr:putative LPS assembly protein LptD [Bergeyella sp. RCAD1439]
MSPLILNITRIKIGFKNRLHILIILIFNTFLGNLNAQNKSKNEIVNDTVSTTKNQTPTPKEQLDDVVETNADHIRNDLPKKMTYLNKNAKISYQDMVINADYISIDWNTGNVFARGKLNEKGRVIEPVITEQGGKKYETDQFNFNYKSRQAIAYNARTEESEGIIVAEKTKKINDSIFYMRRGKYTTDEYFLQKKDTIADYYLLAPTIKLIKGKKKSQVITGPIQMYIEQVPTPLALPFGILPFSDKRSAGILIPSFGERQDVGFFLNGLGYYQPIGQHFDVKILADFFTKGSWNLRPEVNYKKNYRYSGNFSSEVGATVRGIKGLADYSKSSTYRIGWRHQQDAKANPYFTFSASVDIVSNRFYNNTINNNYIFNQSVLNTQQNSTLSATKRFLTLPITITSTASYSQNFADGTVNLRLPQMNVAINQFYLFRPKNGGVRQGLLENITVNTGFNFSNFVNNVKQENMFTSTMWNNMQTGLQNNIGLTTNTNLLRYFTFSVSASANNVLTNKYLTRAYNPLTNAVENTYHKSISGFSVFSASTSLQTTLYGMLNFKKGAFIEKVRHMMIPSIGLTYQPDFGEPRWGYFRQYYNAQGALTPYSIFDGGLFGSPSTGMIGALTYNISNNLEMKVRSKQDSVGVKKIKLFETLNVSGAYNFAAKSFKWSMINVSGQTSFMDGKLSLNSSLVIDPYKTTYDANGTGTRTEEFGGFNVQGFNVQLAVPLSESLFNKDQKKPSERYKSKGEIRYENYFFDDHGYAHFAQPWTLNLNANYAYTKGTTRFGNSVASLGLTGTLKLTPYWNISGSTNYDFITKELAYTRLGFHRDQRSFVIDFNWVPFGRYKVYDFFIGIKANILRDALKYRDRSFTDPTANF